MTRFILVTVSILVLAATSSVLADSYGKSELPAAFSDTTLFAASLASVNSRNINLLSVADNTTLFQATIDPVHAYLAPAMQKTADAAPVIDINTYTD
jgi:hypothetical protein